jgi:hypothetical protein
MKLEFIGSRTNAPYLSSILEMAENLKTDLSLFSRDALEDETFQNLLNIEDIKPKTTEESSLLDKIDSLKTFLLRVDELVPYLTLALNQSSQTQALKISPSLLLQASAAFKAMPEFQVRLYTLFGAAIRKSKTVADWSWCVLF